LFPASKTDEPTSEAGARGEGTYLPGWFSWALGGKDGDKNLSEIGFKKVGSYRTTQLALPAL